MITLSTDFGLQDPYVGIMKGVILGINPRVPLVDLTHALSHHDLLGAAFVLQSTYSYFPKGTIHLAVVDPGVGGERRLIGIQTDDSIWVGPDNGLFTLIVKDFPEVNPIHLTNSAFFLKEVSSTFHGRDLLAPVAAHLSLGVPLGEMGPIISDPVLLSVPEPEIQNNALIGLVLWVDHFGNLITNINQKKLLPFLSGFSLRIEIGSQTITGLSQTYSQGRPGQLMALIGSSGYLEIAANLGSAAEKVGFRSGMEFKVMVVAA
ncbi:MAG: SAM-dependent chlorinase/fluorinase [Deltaproteobacteria bacterium]|nr:SAM-dependent chlorinase/fluorinase [Deltaproteobacteria bacterium]